jgi:hypothetical protein
MIALLPLRGWSAERMAVSMAVAMAASPALASGAHHAAMPADCPMLLTKDGGDGKTERSCQTCQLCMSLAAAEAPAAKAAAHQQLAATTPSADRFSSADLARAAKPPIS